MKLTVGQIDQMIKTHCVDPCGFGISQIERLHALVHAACAEYARQNDAADVAALRQQIADMLEGYALNYDDMARHNSGDPRVQMRSVACDIRQNMKAFVLRVQPRTLPPTVSQVDLRASVPASPEQLRAGLIALARYIGPIAYDRVISAMAVGK